MRVLGLSEQSPRCQRSSSRRNARQAKSQPSSDSTASQGRSPCGLGPAAGLWTALDEHAHQGRFATDVLGLDGSRSRAILIHDKPTGSIPLGDEAWRIVDGRNAEIDRAGPSLTCLISDGDAESRRSRESLRV